MKDHKRIKELEQEIKKLRKINRELINGSIKQSDIIIKLRLQNVGLKVEGEGV